MNHPCSNIVRSCSLAAATLLGVGVATPAFASSLRLPFDMMFTTYDYVLGGLLVALIVGLVTTIEMRVQHQPNEEPHEEGPDLRWWKTHHQM